MDSEISELPSPPGSPQAPQIENNEPASPHMSPSQVEVNDKENEVEPESPPPPDVDTEVPQGDGEDDEAKFNALFEGDDDGLNVNEDARSPKRARTETEEIKPAKKQRLIKNEDTEGEVPATTDEYEDEDNNDNANEDVGTVGGLGYEEIEKAKIYEKEFSDLLSKVRAPRKRASRDKLDKEKIQEISGSLGDFIIKMETAWELDRSAMKR